MVWIEAKGLQVESTAIFGPNVVSFLLTPVARRWYVVGAYKPPNDVRNVHRLEQTLRATPKVLETIMMGDMNAHMGDPRDGHEEDLVTALVDKGLVNMKYHFFPRRRYWGEGIWMWSM